MEPFTTLTAIAAPIDERNLDTNQLCPTRYNKLARDDPFYAKVLFNNQRFAADGSLRDSFILNREPYSRSGILVADENFGCGSSRESAVYALLAFGIRCVVAPSFGDIFYNNCTKNALLPVRLDRAVCDALRQALHDEPGARMTVDLEGCVVHEPGGAMHPFEVHPTIRHELLQGRDDVGVTLQSAARIAEFEASYRSTRPWVFE